MRIKITAPKVTFYHQIKRAKLEATLNTVAIQTANLYQQCVATWTHRPRITIEGPRRVGDNYEVTVGPDPADPFTNIFNLVEAGAPPHLIAPRFRGVLRFQTGYKPKTEARRIGSTRGGKFGPYRFAKLVRHPGFVGREFTTTIRRVMEPQFRDALLRFSEAYNENLRG